MFRNKRASLELSVNAIVIFILAVLLLGLAIGFLKSMYDKLTGNIDQISSDVEKRMLQRLEDSPERLIMDPDNVDIEKGKTKEVYLALRNELDKKYTFVIKGTGSIDVGANPGNWLADDSTIACYDAFDSTAVLSGKNQRGDDIFIEANDKRSIELDKSMVGKMEIKVSGKAKESTYNCAIVIEDPTSPGQEYARKEFIVTVTG